LKLAVEIAFEFVAPFIDLIDQRLDLLVRQTLRRSLRQHGN
jgi:hypothetical protein